METNLKHALSSCIHWIKSNWNDNWCRFTLDAPSRTPCFPTSENLSNNFIACDVCYHEITSSSFFLLFLYYRVCTIHFAKGGIFILYSSDKWFLNLVFNKTVYTLRNTCARCKMYIILICQKRIVISGKLGWIYNMIFCERCLVLSNFALYGF